MREIKFRAWSKKNKAMFFEGFTFVDFTQMEFHKTDWNDLQVMQCTGLLDKNGKEIYEGDFLIDNDDEPMRHRIVWVEHGARFQLETLEDEEGNWSWGLIDSLDDLPDGKGRMYDFEIIGNIYENKELIK